LPAGILAPAASMSVGNISNVETISEETWPSGI